MDGTIAHWNKPLGCAESPSGRLEGNHTVRITMIGGGYVGLVSGACFAEFGTDVTVMETDATKLAALHAGRMPIYEPGLKSWSKRTCAPVA